MSNVLMITLFIAETTCNATTQMTFRPLSKPTGGLRVQNLPTQNTGFAHYFVI